MRWKLIFCHSVGSSQGKVSYASGLASLLLSVFCCILSGSGLLYIVVSYLVLCVDEHECVFVASALQGFMLSYVEVSNGVAFLGVFFCVG